MVRLTSFLLLALPALALAQTDNPNSSCTQDTRDIIQACLDQVVADEAALPVPCSSSDWPCICNVQQGKIACYKPCPELQPYDDIVYNNNQCRGQNGVTNAAGGNPAGQYQGSQLTTEAPGSGGATPTAYESTSSSASSTTTSSSSLASSTSSSSGSATTPTGSAAPSGNQNNAASGVHSLPLGAFKVTAALVLGGAAIGAFAL